MSQRQTPISKFIGLSFLALSVVLSLQPLVVSAQSTGFVVGARVQTTSRLNVRGTPSTSGKKLGTESIGALGSIINGPQSGNGYTWWDVQYDNGLTGWSVQTYLAVVTSVTPAPTVSLAASPVSIVAGQSSTLTWTSNNAASCTGSNFTTSATAGSVTVSPTTSTTYSITCTGTGGSTTQSTSVTVTSSSDTTAPSIPASLSATAISSSAINLTWAASTDNVGVTGYKIYRGGTQIGTSATNSYSDAGLTASTSYSYTVSAYDVAGNNSIQSTSVSATTQAGSSGGSGPGLITSFSAADNTFTSIDGVQWYVENANKTYSLTEPDNHTLRFEVHPGDNWEGSGTSRSEVAGPTIPANAAINISYTMTVEPNALNNPVLSWRIFGQLHANDSLGASPPFLIGVKGSTGDQMIVEVLSGSPSNPTDHLVYTDTANILHGHPYVMQIQINYSNSSAGYVRVWRDGVQIANYSGPVGYGGDGYWKYGVYQGDFSTVNSNVAVDYSNFSLSTGTTSSDTTAPSTPAGLTATAVSSSQINLAWTASTDNVGVTGYKIYRGGTQIGTSATNSYSDTGLTASTAYSYTISAYDAAGNNSAQSSSASATTQAGSDTTAPSVPTGLSASVISTSAINLTWAASTDNVGVAGYKIYRGGVQVGTATTNSYSDTGLTASTTYSYSVSAYDAAGNNSLQSSTVSATTQSSGGGGATLAIDGHANGQDGGVGSTGISLTTAQANDVIVLQVTSENQSKTATTPISSISDSRGLTWHLLMATSSTKMVGWNGPVGTDMEIWWAVAPSALSADKIVPKFSDVTDCISYVAYGVSGANTTSPWDSNNTLPATAINVSTNGLTPTVSSVSTNAANAILLGFFGTDEDGSDNNHTGYTAGSGFTSIDQNLNGSCSLASAEIAEYKMLSAPQSSGTVTLGGTVKGGWFMAAHAIKAAGIASATQSSQVAAVSSSTTLEALVKLLTALQSILNSYGR